MNLYIVTDCDRWGYSINLVRASSPEEAQRIACPHSNNFEVEPIVDGDEARVLWCRDESPDSPREYDDD